MTAFLLKSSVELRAGLPAAGWVPVQLTREADVNGRFVTRVRGGQLLVLATASLLGACGGDGGTTGPPDPEPVSTVSVALAASTIFVSQTTQATAELKDAQGAVLSGRAIAWSSSNTAVATVSTSGLVSGVTAGTSSIVATSEGKSGQASLTVTVDPATIPQISAITVTQNGAPANLTQVAGNLTLSFQLQIPSGYNGTLVVKVDSVEFLRKTVSAPALSARLADGATASPTVVTVNETATLETARTSTMVTTNQIRELPYLTNKSYAAVMTVTPGVVGGTTTQQSVNFTSANPLHAHMLYGIDGAPVQGTDGKSYTGGSGIAAVWFAAYANEEISSFEIGLTDHRTEYGRSTGGAINVYQRITRNDLNKFPLPPHPIEKDNLTYVLTGAMVNGNYIYPQATYLGTGNFTSDAIGSGWANTPQQALDYPVVSPRTFVSADIPAATLFSSGLVKGRAGIDILNLDNVGPRQSSAPNLPVFSYQDRWTTVGDPAFWPTGGYGANNSQLSSRYDFGGGFRANRLTDITEVDLAATAYYAGPFSEKANLFTLQYKIGTSFTLNESSGSRTYVAGARAFDRRGNHSDWWMRTSVGNLYNQLGQQSTGGQVGVDEASFGFTNLRAALGTSGIPDVSTWNSTVMDPTIGWNFNASSSIVGMPPGWLSARAKLNGTYGFGAGAAKDEFQVISSSGGATSGTATAVTKAFTDAINNLQVPIGQGLYELEFKGADNAGRYIGDMMWPRVRQFFVDAIPPSTPSITFNSPVVPGDVNSANLIGADNLGITRVRLGIRYNYAAAVTGGQIYTPIAEFSLPGSISSGRLTSLNYPITGVAPVGFWFYNPFSGVVDWGNFHRSNGATLETMDYAWNLSSVYFTSFTNTAPVPALNNVSDVRSSISSSDWCPGTCTSGGNKLIDLNFSYFDDRPTGDLTLSKAEWFAIPPGGRVYPLGKQTSFTSATEGIGRRIRYNMTLDLSDYCGPTGTALIFPIGYAKDGKASLKAGSFSSANIKVAARYSNRCNTPPPLLPPPPPPP